MNYAAMTDDLVEFLDAHGLESAAFIGHSMGGKAAMEFALRHPGRTKAIVIVDIAPRSYPPHHDHIFDALVSVHLSDHESRTTVERALAQSIESPAVRQFLMKNLKRDDGNAFQWKMNLEALRLHYDEINGEIVSSGSFRGPSLFIGGEKSDYLSANDLPSIRRLFPQAQLKTLDTGHWVHAEAPDKFFRIVMDFLEEAGYLSPR
jgi:pimeloyl-ACP methyl ester carboxylesterase